MRCRSGFATALARIVSTLGIPGRAGALAIKQLDSLRRRLGTGDAKLRSEEFHASHRSGVREVLQTFGAATSAFSTSTEVANLFACGTTFKKLAAIPIGLSFSLSAHAFGASELMLCEDAGKALTFETYIVKLREYLSARTGLVPAWLIAQAASTTKTRYPDLSGSSEVAGEIAAYCEAMNESDELVRYTKVLALVSAKAGPIGSLISTSLSSASSTLAEGVRLFTGNVNGGNQSLGKFSFNVKIYDEDSWLYFDKAETGVAISANVVTANILLRGPGIGPVAVERAFKLTTARDGTENCAKGETMPCYYSGYGYIYGSSSDYPTYGPDTVVVGVRLDFRGGQRLYIPVDEFPLDSSSHRTVLVTAQAIKGAGPFFVPR